MATTEQESGTALAEMPAVLTLKQLGDVLGQSLRQMRQWQNKGMFRAVGQVKLKQGRPELTFELNQVREAIACMVTKAQLSKLGLGMAGDRMVTLTEALALLPGLNRNRVERWQQAGLLPSATWHRRKRMYSLRELLKLKANTDDVRGDLSLLTPPDGYLLLADAAKRLHVRQSLLKNLLWQSMAAREHIRRVRLSPTQNKFSWFVSAKYVEERATRTGKALAMRAANGLGDSQAEYVPDFIPPPEYVTENMRARKLAAGVNPDCTEDAVAGGESPELQGDFIPPDEVVVIAKTAPRVLDLNPFRYDDAVVLARLDKRRKQFEGRRIAWRNKLRGQAA